MKRKLLSRRRITSAGCWEYTGYVSTHGYAKISYMGKTIYVHILSMLLFKAAEYKDYLNVLHKCNNRKCFNPDHLYSGTQSSNALDAVKSGTHFQASKTHCKNGHEFTKENTYIRPNGSRECRTCMRDRDIVRRFVGLKK